jgi:hypothetical protein
LSNVFLKQIQLLHRIYSTSTASAGAATATAGALLNAPEVLDSKCGGRKWAAGSEVVLGGDSVPRLRDLKFPALGSLGFNEAWLRRELQMCRLQRCEGFGFDGLWLEYFS